MDIENFQEKHDQLWERARTLADKIDDHQGGIPVEIRRRMLPELNRLRNEIARMEGQGPIPQNKGIEQPEPKEANLDVCPARCKQTGRCYARAYFKGKPGPAAECVPEKCKQVGA